jgi:hypothetical protein
MQDAPDFFDSLIELASLQNSIGLGAACAAACARWAYKMIFCTSP